VPGRVGLGLGGFGDVTIIEMPPCVWPYLWTGTRHAGRRPDTAGQGWLDRGRVEVAVVRPLGCRMLAQSPVPSTRAKQNEP
jgi:hypothetical protein